MTNDDQLRRLIQLLGMLGSKHDGEALNAARAVMRQLGAMGMTWEQVLSGGRERDSAFMDGWRQGFRTGRESAERSRLSNWGDFARTIHDNHRDRLNDWEIGFIDNYVANGWDEPTPRQQMVLERMGRKLGLQWPDD